MQQLKDKPKISFRDKNQLLLTIVMAFSSTIEHAYQAFLDLCI